MPTTEKRSCETAAAHAKHTFKKQQVSGNQQPFEKRETKTRLTPCVRRLPAREVHFLALLLLFRPRRVPRGGWFLAAVAGYAACLVTFVVATKWTTAANAIFLQYTGVVWVLLAAPFFLPEERITIPKVAGLAVGFAGVLLLVAPDLVNLGDSDLTGELMMLGSSLS